MNEFQLDMRSYVYSKAPASLKRLPVALLFLGAGLLAKADTSVVFNFNSLYVQGTSNYMTNNQTIQTYMNGVLQAAGCTGCTVTVSDGNGGFVFADRNYTGENFVVGKNGSPDTLGTTDGATANDASHHTGDNDTFLSNVNDSSSSPSGSSQIDLKFSGPNGTTFSGTVSFDFEIFPNGTCASLTTRDCGSKTNGIYANQPDFVFQEGLNSASDYSSFGSGGKFYSAAPGSNGPNGEGSDGASTKNGNNTIAAPQWIGTYSTTLGSFNELNFLDWPAAIGIDNLSVTFQTPVPETSSVVLFGTLSLFLVPFFRRRRKA